MFFLYFHFIFFFFGVHSLHIGGTLTGSTTRDQDEPVCNNNYEVVLGSAKSPISRWEALLSDGVYRRTQDWGHLEMKNKNWNILHHQKLGLKM